MSKNAENLQQVVILVPLAASDKLQGGFYDYLAPSEVYLSAGDYVQVTLGRQQVVGVVWPRPADTSIPPHKLKKITQKLEVPRLPPVMQDFVDKLAGYTLSAPGTVLRMVLGGTGALQLPQEKKRVLKPKAAPILPPPQVPQLSTAQIQAAHSLVQATRAQNFSCTLLDGVTGSGKTEVFMEAMAAALQAGQQVLLLVPEISLTTQLVQRVAARFGIMPTEWHSTLTPAQRRRNWHAIAGGDAKLVVGARSALLLPMPQLGLVVVDEEHEATYKQEEGVIYHARDMAVLRAKLQNCAVILSSATPSLETWSNVQAGKYARVVLAARFAAADLPSVQLVDLRQEPMPKVAGKQSWLSPTLRAAMQQQLQQQAQTLLFLNRRGYAPLTLCRACGHRVQCPQCTAWLVMHGGSNNAKNPRLICHHCGCGKSMPAACPSCHAPESLVACGPGVERVAEEAQNLFPTARMAVLTSDLTPSAAQQVVADMAAGNIDILVGTQLVTKGHNFGNLTLVGVVDADLGLGGSGSGDLRAAEKMFQVLTQVGGRAGRVAGKVGRVLVQTTAPEQKLLQALAQHARDDFLAAELALRQAYAMPPAGRLASVLLSSPDEAAVQRAAKALAQAAPHGIAGVKILGPAPAPLAMLRGRHRLRFLVKGGANVRLQPVVADWLARVDLPRSVRLAIDIDPQSFV